MLRFSFLTALLAAAATTACAETPLPDPIAPAVIGRPLSQIRPMHPARPKVAKVQPQRPRQPATARMGAAGAPPAQLALAPAAAPLPATAPHAAKQAVDDRADPNAPVVDNVGQGTHFARKPLGSGVYLGAKHQELVRRYYAAHPVSAHAAHWKIGEPMPRDGALAGVPDELRAALPPLPPGYQYVQLDGEVVMVAIPSRMVVDGVSRATR